MSHGVRVCLTTRFFMGCRSSFIQGIAHDLPHNPDNPASALRLSGALNSELSYRIHDGTQGQECFVPACNSPPTAPLKVALCVLAGANTGRTFFDTTGGP